VATSAVDTDFTAKLIDAYPPSAWYPQGDALNLTDSIARLRYRNGRERGELVTPGEPVNVEDLDMPAQTLSGDAASRSEPEWGRAPTDAAPPPEGVSC
jgi:predicted acyl esterase